MPMDIAKRVEDLLTSRFSDTGGRAMNKGGWWRSKAHAFSVSMMALVVASLASVALANSIQAPAPAIVPIKASKIILIGDSTVAVKGGWGPSFCAEHVTSFAACVNLARGGRSTKSYIAEGSWELALAEARVPGFVTTWMLIQFGHNDQPGKPGRSTDLETEFPANLRRYVNEARAAGAQPILVTPLTRRMFKDGILENSLSAWAATTTRIAEEMKVPLIDLNKLSSTAVQQMGSTEANTFAQLPAPPAVAAAAAKGTTIPPPTETNDRPPVLAQQSAADPNLPPLAQPKVSFDYTHLGRKGADYFAAMVAKELAAQVPQMRPLLIL
jgi:lysophospholipase L1-like esterase